MKHAYSRFHRHFLFSDMKTHIAIKKLIPKAFKKALNKTMMILYHSLRKMQLDTYIYFVII